MKKDGKSEETCLYFDITKEERDSAIRYLLGAIINSRKQSNFPSNYYTFDEDVNVYLAHLLLAVSLPEYHEMSEPYLSADSSDILNWVRGTEDKTMRYFIFKVNADHILIHSAIFDGLAKKQSKVMKRSPKHYIELAQLYYDQAALYHNKIYRKKTGMGEVLVKMARYFEAYQALLKMVRREYFSFVTGFRDHAFTHFMGEVKHYENECRKKILMDEFLDVYARWLGTKAPPLKQDILRVVEQIREIDPDFNFDTDRELNGGGFQDERECA